MRSSGAKIRKTEISKSKNLKKITEGRENCRRILVGLRTVMRFSMDHLIDSLYRTFPSHCLFLRFLLFHFPPYPLGLLSVHENLIKDPRILLR